MPAGTTTPVRPSGRCAWSWVSPRQLVRPSVVSSDIQAYHPFPIGPVVGPSVPDPERVADPLLPEQRGKLPIVVARGVVLPHGQDDGLAGEAIEPSGIVLVPDEVRRVAGVDVVIGVPAGEPLHVVQ